MPQDSILDADSRRTHQPDSLRLWAEGFSVKGTNHVVNEDRFLIDSDRGCYVVADGMGGMRAGEQAAQMAVELLPNVPALLALETPSPENFQQALTHTFREVSAEIESAGNLDYRLKGMGTTAVLAQRVHDLLFIGSLGDSRAYLYRQDAFEQLTTDHNMAQALLDMGAITPEAAHRHHWRNMLWKYLGAPDSNEGPDICTVHLQAGDRLLLATDGVTGVLEDRQLHRTVACQTTPADVARSVVHAAVARGTRDDATCVAISVER